MAETKVQDDGLPKGRVTEVCQEWMVREDGALAYRLQNQEISEHLSGNRHRNALVREDFPRAKIEQLREQELAEHTAMIYQRMLAEQEQHDQIVAKQLAEQLEREERQKRRMIDGRDQTTARQLLDEERANQNEYSPRRQSRPMPLPVQNDLYTVPYTNNEEIPKRKDSYDLDRIDIDAANDIGLPLDEFTEKQIQEEKDAELARKLQEQEDSLDDTLMNRDRLLAIEAQDKELAKLLQERERNKARRARERAKQKALAKKQQQQQQQLMPDDSYSYPADLIQTPRPSKYTTSDTYALPNQDEDINYSLPVDVLPSATANLNENYQKQDKLINGVNQLKLNDSGMAVRPTNLDLKTPLNRINKPRYPDPQPNDQEPSSSPSPSSHINIAMVIDPTYPRRSNNGNNVIQSSSSFDTSSSTVTTSTSSGGSPAMILPPPDLTEIDDETVVPPYMPIQGQRRTASLEKKQKKKSKEGGCKQQ